MNTAICTKCGEPRALSDYEWRKDKGRRRKVCNPCVYARRREREHENPELLKRARARTAKWREQHPDYVPAQTHEERRRARQQLHRAQEGAYV